MIEMSGGEDGTYRLGYAGDTLNTAWYARARLAKDWDVDYVTALATTSTPSRCADFFTKNGIGTDLIQTIPNRRPGLYLIHQAHGDRHFTYWRGQSAAKQLADDTEALNAALAGADIAYFSGISLAILNRVPAASLMKAHPSGPGSPAPASPSIPNERPVLWTSPEVMASTITAGAILADIVLPTFPDEQALFGDASPEAVAERYTSWRRRGSGGQERRRTGLRRLRESRGWVAPKPGAKSVDPTGAGDSFNGAYLAARAEGADAARAAEKAHALAAIVIGHKGALVPHDRL